MKFDKSYPCIGLSKFLIISVIKLCSINNIEGTILYLQLSFNSPAAISLYTNIEFFLHHQNNHNNIPISIQIPLAKFADEKTYDADGM